MGHRVCVIDVPGMSRELLAAVPPHSALGRWLAGKTLAGLTPTFPAVTCSVQATLSTGQSPSRHGIIANGLPTFRFPQDQALVDASNFASFRRQISFWEQSNQFLECPRFWQDSSGRSKWKTALLFFQNSMPGFAGLPRPAADIVLTPKPDHGTDGKLTSLCWSQPPELVPNLFKQFGTFPLMNYWGPMAGIASSQWIARAGAFVWNEHQPRLQWTYLPHLDYDLQRFGPHSDQAKKAVADLAGAMEPLLSAILNSGGKVVLLSEYAMREVNSSIAPNQILARADLLQTRSTPDGALIDFENSQAIAMVDHQIAHVYVRDPGQINLVRDTFDAAGISIAGQSDLTQIAHRRAGQIVLLAKPSQWFDYRWWTSGQQAPGFAGMVDIHRKPGYDPLELFWDPAAKGISQNSSLLHGSHGLVEAGEGVFAWDGPGMIGTDVAATDVAGLLSVLLS